jgi:hypothetical protein
MRSPFTFAGKLNWISGCVPPEIVDINEIEAILDLEPYLRTIQLYNYNCSLSDRASCMM